MSALQACHGAAYWQLLRHCKETSNKTSCFCSHLFSPSPGLQKRLLRTPGHLLTWPVQPGHWGAWSTVCFRPRVGTAIWQVSAQVLDLSWESCFELVWWTGVLLIRGPSDVEESLQWWLFPCMTHSDPGGPEREAPSARPQQCAASGPGTDPPPGSEMGARGSSCSAHREHSQVSKARSKYCCPEVQAHPAAQALHCRSQAPSAAQPLHQKLGWRLKKGCENAKRADCELLTRTQTKLSWHLRMPSTEHTRQDPECLWSPPRPRLGWLWIPPHKHLCLEPQPAVPAARRPELVWYLC